ncbi:MAG: NAD(P)-dependent oxidoreductase [Clostridia bacterium]|nr:NAD(P)-dependent oxidoreductase [Clostridia bacterium]
MKIAITGVTGNMGQAVFAALENENYIEKIVLLAHNKKKLKKLLNKHKKLRGKTQVVEGNFNDKDVCANLIKDCDIVLNMAAVIPPKSDASPKNAEVCNQLGTYALVSAIEESQNQPKLIHISTVALYGNRTAPHPFARVGDPLVVSPFDIYSATKLRAEFRVLESGIKTWAVLRQTAMLHPNMLTDNLHSGLMFHTCYDAPLEWVTAHDSGLLIRNLLSKEAANELPESFWKKCYNIAGGAINRSYGIDSLNGGLALIGGNAKQFFNAGDNAIRNFHGVWYSDGNILNDLFNFQTQSIADYWKEIKRNHKIYAAGKIVPKSLIRHFAIKPLLKDPIAPAFWAKNNEAHIIAFFGERAEYEKLQQKSWDDVIIPALPALDAIPENETPLFYGYDFGKRDEDIDLADLKAVAQAHGGKLITDNFVKGDIYTKLEWETQDGERFIASPYTVLRAGHWHNPVYDGYVWDFDRLCKKDRIFASVWYDSHKENENMRYYCDENFTGYAEKLQK